MYRKEEKIPGVRCYRHEDEDPDGYYYLTIELHHGFGIQATLCKTTGSVRCELWDDRNSLTQNWQTIPNLDVPDADSYEHGLLCEGLSMTPYEFLEWREVACGREPREHFGTHWRATHQAGIAASLAEPVQTYEQARAELETMRLAELPKTPEEKEADREALKASQAAYAAERKKEIEDQVRALQADAGAVG